MLLLYSVPQVMTSSTASVCRKANVEITDQVSLMCSDFSKKETWCLLKSAKTRSKIEYTPRCVFSRPWCILNLPSFFAQKVYTKLFLFLTIPFFSSVGVVLLGIQFKPGGQASQASQASQARQPSQPSKPSQPASQASQASQPVSQPAKPAKPARQPARPASQPAKPAKPDSEPSRPGRQLASLPRQLSQPS